jgi:choline-sulfatase
MTASHRLVIFVSDNHNRSVAGCYGHPVVRTPYIDALARRGTRFANAYSTSPLCCPARAAMATGRYPHQTGYWDNVMAYDGAIPSWMHRLRDQGHHVTAIGKLHYRSTDDDNGFTREILPMHLHEGKGALKGLLRGFDAQKPKEPGVMMGLYDDLSREGDTHYQDYDRQITDQAIAWLREHRAEEDKAPVLVVSYISPHPPFTVAKRFLDLYPQQDMPLPPEMSPPFHPSVAFARGLDGMPDRLEPAVLRRIAAGYFGLITHMDEQIGVVLQEMETLGMLDATRIVYTSDHGELFGAQGMFGKRSLFEGAAGVPLVMAGQGIRAGHVSRQLVSHVDLFPTLLDMAGGRPEAADADLPGISLWPAAQGHDDPDRPVFAEYHAQGSRSAAYLVRLRDEKMIFHVGMPTQTFDLRADPDELHDLHGTPRGDAIERALMPVLRAVCDPQREDERAKAAQRARADEHGGPEVVGREAFIAFTPPPGVSSEEAWASLDAVAGASR